MKTYAVLRYVTEEVKTGWRTCGNSGEEFGTFEEKRGLFNRLTYQYPKEHYRLVNVEYIEDSKR